MLSPFSALNVAFTWCVTSRYIIIMASIMIVIAIIMIAIAIIMIVSIIVMIAIAIIMIVSIIIMIVSIIIMIVIATIVTFFSSSKRRFHFIQSFFKQRFGQQRQRSLAKAL